MLLWPDPKTVFLKHVPKPNAVLVRSYGLYCQNKKDELEKCRAFLGQQPVEEPQTLDWQDCFKDSNDHPELCPICGKRLVMTTIHKPAGMLPHQSAQALLKPHLKEAA